MSRDNLDYVASQLPQAKPIILQTGRDCEVDFFPAEAQDSIQRPLVRCVHHRRFLYLNRQRDQPCCHPTPRPIRRAHLQPLAVACAADHKQRRAIRFGAAHGEIFTWPFADVIPNTSLAMTSSFFCALDVFPADQRLALPAPGRGRRSRPTRKRLRREIG